MRLSSLFIVLLALSFITMTTVSCKRNRKHKKESSYNYDEFAQKLSQQLPGIDSLPQKQMRSLRENMRLAYEYNDHDPIWLSKGYKADKTADKAIAEIGEMAIDGLDPEHYELDRLKALQAKLKEKSAGLADAIAFDTLLTRSYLQAASDLLFGRYDPLEADESWHHRNDTTWNTAMELPQIQAKFIPLDDYRSKLPTYGLLRQEYKRVGALARDTALLRAINAVKGGGTILTADLMTIISKKAPWIKTVSADVTQSLIEYQQYAGLPVTGKADTTTMTSLCTMPQTMLKTLAANLERIRWMQRDPGDTYVLVNVPLMELFFRRGGDDAMHMRVVVGKTSRQTPSLDAVMANVVINPSWGVPPTIAKNDVLPCVEQSGEACLVKKNLKAFDKNGKEVSGDVINASNYKSYMFKQDPGDDNALGYVKFNLPNKWDIYLHDTPHRELFAKEFRAASSGCVRLEQPQEMAMYILNEIEGKNITKAEMDSVISTHKTQWNNLKNKIPVHIVYLTNFEDTSRLHMRYLKDVYGRDKKLISLMNNMPETKRNLALTLK